MIDPQIPLLQDCDRRLSKALAAMPHARQHAIEAAAAINQGQTMTDELPALPKPEIRDGVSITKEGWYSGPFDGYTADQMLAFRAEGVAAERAKWQADAERYRALRNSLSGEGERHPTSILMPQIIDPCNSMLTYTRNGLDAAIDAARNAHQIDHLNTAHRITQWGFCPVCSHSRIPGEGCAKQDCPDAARTA